MFTALKVLFALALSAALTGVVGAAIQTQFNLAALTAIGAVNGGVDIPLQLRLETTWADIQGFGPVFAGLAAVAFIPAFIVARGIIALLGLRYLFYTLAGVAGIATALITANWLAPMPALIVITQTLPGLLAMSAAGLVGGFFFALLNPPRRRRGFMSGGIDHVSFR
ncbi:hypothetical protein E4656_02600 [Natronospirillum operosum]|uniref:Uncharacterized protein n=1 Tax=Natronospirillum operosum TaxID=2759953 RepID=A0A4Z0WE79_9GAMM|nr:hypothetical protein [Natronospirillum operosum]TGG95330.1 hypothetical protein E4656_02600 [Natronospirillum operosum]